MTSNRKSKKIAKNIVSTFEDSSPRKRELNSTHLIIVLICLGIILFILYRYRYKWMYKTINIPIPFFEQGNIIKKEEKHAESSEDINVFS